MMIQRVTLMWVIICSCAIFSVQAEPVSFTNERVEVIYQELPRDQSGAIVDSIYLFPLKITTSGSQIKDVGVGIESLMLDNLHVKSFVERKVLELLLAKSIDEVKLALSHSKCQISYNGVDYNRGLDWSVKSAVRVFNDCTSINYHFNDTHHKVEVKDSKNNRFEIAFPLNIQIVTDKNKMELELEFEELVTSDFDIDIYAKQPTKNRFYKLDDIFVNSTQFLYTEAINDATFYNLQGLTFNPIFSSDYATESFINLFHIANSESCNIDLVVNQSLYGNKTKEFVVPLDKLIAYCRSNGIDVYVGIEGRDGNRLEASVLLDCKSMKYLHILHVSSDVSTLFMVANDGGHKQMMVNLYSFIPTDNIDNLFEQYEEKERKINFYNIN